MCDDERLQEIINDKEDAVTISGAQIKNVQKEGARIENEVMELTKKISLLL